uniref:Uncharacterized protein n=1 Tax=Siphoviridae sp. ctvWR21 TaxID=2827966 RepID=A0A8S5TMF1_9CAUD|nr:MAG TPA: hypothetical protein [Siphoviridae sp. ctvWR21]
MPTFGCMRPGQAILYPFARMRQGLQGRADGDGDHLKTPI